MWGASVDETKFEAVYDTCMLTRLCIPNCAFVFVTVDRYIRHEASILMILNSRPSGLGKTRLFISHTLDGLSTSKASTATD
jgi:hypothetical protein